MHALHVNFILDMFIWFTSKQQAISLFDEYIQQCSVLIIEYIAYSIYSISFQCRRKQNSNSWIKDVENVNRQIAIFWYTVMVLSDILILNKASWCSLRLQRITFAIKGEAATTAETHEGWDGNVSHVHAPSMQRHEVHSRSVLLNTWPVNNYMKEHTKRPPQLKESVASQSCICVSSISTHIRKILLGSFLYAIYLFYRRPSFFLPCTLHD